MSDSEHVEFGPYQQLLWDSIQAGDFPVALVDKEAMPLLRKVLGDITQMSEEQAQEAYWAYSSRAELGKAARTTEDAAISMLSEMDPYEIMNGIHAAEELKAKWTPEVLKATRPSYATPLRLTGFRLHNGRMRVVLELRMELES